MQCSPPISVVYNNVINLYIAEPAGAGRIHVPTSVQLHATTATWHKVRSRTPDRLHATHVSQDLRTVADPAEFRKQLKAHFSTSAFNAQ